MPRGRAAHRAKGSPNAQPLLCGPAGRAGSAPQGPEASLGVCAVGGVALQECFLRGPPPRSLQRGAEVPSLQGLALSLQGSLPPFPPLPLSIHPQAPLLASERPSPS